MKRHNVVYSIDASEDLESLFNAIAFDYQALETAYKYSQGVMDIINGLSRFPEMHPIRTSPSFWKYGNSVRRVNYKKMAILYTVYDDVVFIHRIIAGNMITGL